MKFKIDENLPIEIAELLRQEDHDALTIHDQGMTGEPDDQIAIVCQKEERIIVSLDLDFADIRAYPPSNFAGLIVLRLDRQDKNYVIEMFKRLIKVISAELLEKRLWIVDEKRIRIRE